MRFTVNSLNDTIIAAEQIARSLSFPSCIYLEGAMGAGKTTLITHILHSLGYEGAVTSPTYNLVQEYSIQAGTLYHMDLYRVNDPMELEFLAIDDLWSKNSIFMIEWPDRGAGFLPAADLSLTISKRPLDGEQAREFVLSHSVAD